MPELRCKCGTKIAEYNDSEVRIMDRKCKTITVLRVVDGKLELWGISPLEKVDWCKVKLENIY